MESEIGSRVIGTEVGVISVLGAPHASLDLVNGEGDEDNSRFDVVNNSLVAREVFDFESGGPYSVRVRAEISTGENIEGVFTVLLTDRNEPPSSMRVIGGRLSVDENLPIGALVGEFAANDPDADEEFTFSLAAYPGIEDDLPFEFRANKLFTRESLDHETRGSFEIAVQVADKAGATYLKRFLLYVNNVNEAPTEIEFSGSSVNIRSEIDSVVGQFSAHDPDLDRSRPTLDHFYDLVSGEGDTHNDLFYIVDNELFTLSFLDFAPETLSIRVKVSDIWGASFEQTMTLTLDREVLESELSNPIVTVEAPDVRLSFETELGALYFVEATKDLEHWFVIDSLIKGTGEIVERAYPALASELGSQAYFRIGRVPGDPIVFEVDPGRIGATIEEHKGIPLDISRLGRLVAAGQEIVVTVIFPEGKEILAEGGSFRLNLGWDGVAPGAVRGRATSFLDKNLRIIPSSVGGSSFASNGTEYSLSPIPDTRPLRFRGVCFSLALGQPETAETEVALQTASFVINPTSSKVSVVGSN